MNLTKHPSIIEAAEETGLDLTPDVTAAIRLAIDIGIERERDRSCGLLDLGRKTGAWRTAYGAIKSGATMTPTLFEAFAQAGRAHIELELRLEDDDVVEAAILNAKRPPSSFTDPLAAEVYDQLSAMVGDSADDSRIEDLDA